MLTEPSHPPHLPTSGNDMQAELGDPRAREGSCGKLCLGGPRGLGSPAVSPRGEGSRERQDGPPSGKQRSRPAETQERPRVWAARRRGWGDPGLPWPLGTASPPDGSLGGLRAGRGHGGWELTDGVSIYMEPSYVRGGGDAPWGEPQASEEDSGSIATL